VREVKPWGEYFLGLAHKATERSKDPNTNVGAVIVDEDHNVVSTGYNGFPRGVKETPGRWERPLKYEYVVHAEENAIGCAARTGRATDGCKMYVTHFPCKDCAKMIITAGIKHLIVDGRGKTAMNDEEQQKFTRGLLSEAGVEVFILNGPSV
jgi:dCMP deaminase